MSTHKLIYTLLFLISFCISASAQTTSNLRYVELYNSGDYAASADILESSTDSESGKKDAQQWNYLGLCQIKLNDNKAAIKSFKKAVRLAPTNPTIQFNYAYSLFLTNDKATLKETRKALELNPKSAGSFYILGKLELWKENYRGAYSWADKALESDPDHTPSLLLKVDSLIGSFGVQTGIVVPETTKRSEFLFEAIDLLTKYLDLKPNDPYKKPILEYIASLKYHADLIAFSEDEDTRLGLSPSEQPPGKEALKISSKPRAISTTDARRYEIQGSVRLLVGFDKTGKIVHILRTKSLGFGLDEAAEYAANMIKFSPATMNGKPISESRTVEYIFSIIGKPQ